MRRTGWLIGGAIAGLLGAVAAWVAIVDDSDGETEPTRHAARAVTPAQLLPTTLPLATRTTVATTEPPTAALAPPTGDDRLSSNSRLGYAGLGPIKLGMSYPDVERVGQVTLRQTDCLLTIQPHEGSGLDPIPAPYGTGTITGLSAWGAFPITEPRVIDVIEVGHPAIYTISGIHVGSTADDVKRTYTNTVEAQYAWDADRRPLYSLTITNPEGRAVQFLLDADGVIVHMSVGLGQKIIEDHRLC
jgi:hypothetical protein